MDNMETLKVGHFTDQNRGTGVTAFLMESSAIGAYWICGSAPATHELVVLDPDNSVPKCHGLVFAGGSAYGLYAAKGAMTYLTERKLGHPTMHGVVPIVPAVAIYDLAYKEATPPTEAECYQACLSAKKNNTASGRIGAGTGATVGKLIPDAKSMSGGLGYAEIEIQNGIKVVAYAVVNCVGDVRDEAHHIIAGAKTKNNQFADCEKYLISGQGEKDLFAHTNTTLVAVFTNVKFSKGELKRIAKMAIAGIARAITPIFTRYDGDILFCFSIGTHQASELTIGTIATEVVRLAILNAVKDSVVL